MNTVSPLRRSDDLAIEDGGAPPGGAPPQKPEDAERAIRTRAAQAHDDWAAGRAEEPRPYDCDNFADGARHDFDGCAKGPLARSVLFVKEEKDANAIDAADVKQARIGDCHFMAPLMALAGTSGGRALIHDAIAENKNAKGEVESYTVRLFEAESSFWGAKTFSELKVMVAATFPSGCAEARHDEDDVEVWTDVLEKAYATIRGGYNRIHAGGDPGNAIEALTGKPAERFGFGWFGYGPRQLEKDLAAGKIVVINTKEVEGGPYGLTATHSYEVVASTLVDGKSGILLRDPRRLRDPEPIPFDQLGAWFSSVTVGSTR
jgi:hypothetical protein